MTAEENPLLSNNDRQNSQPLVSQHDLSATKLVSVGPPQHAEPQPEPEVGPQRTRSTEELIAALHARGFRALERRSYGQDERFRFSAVDREAFDRELGSVSVVESSDGELGLGDAGSLTEGREDQLRTAGVPLEFRFSRCTTEFYHGTSLDAAMKIQTEGFRVDLSGTNAGKMLGPGLYCTTTLEKAVNYAKRMKGAGVIFRLEVDLGKCYHLKKGDSHMKDWHTKLGYDSCWSPAGANGIREENCIADPKNRVRIVEAIFGDTRQAEALGYSIDRLTGLVVLNPERAAAAEAAGFESRGRKARKKSKAEEVAIGCFSTTILLLIVYYNLGDNEDDGDWQWAADDAMADGNGKNSSGIPTLASVRAYCPGELDICMAAAGCSNLLITVFYGGIVQSDAEGFDALKALWECMET